MRPPIYTKETAEAVLAELASGQTLSAICRKEGMPSRAEVWRWIKGNENGFRDSYAQAREIQAEVWADEIREKAAVADPENVQVVRLQVDLEKWLMARNHPVRFGDKIQQEHSGSVKYEVVTGVPEPEKPSNA